MIFGNGYDSSLWLIMKSDRENRKRIANFIRNIPEELYLEIKEKLSTIDDYRKSHRKFVNKDGIYFHGNCKKDDKLYYYRIDQYCYGLALGCSIFNGESYDEIFEINIYPKDNLEKVSKEEYTPVGSIESGCDSINRGTAKTLCVSGGVLSKTPFRFMIWDSSWSEILNIGIVNVKSIPEELDYKDLSKHNRLVRRKKRK